MKKLYEGSVFDRLRGLSFFRPFCNSHGAVSVLDIGCCTGHVAYEFARMGAKVIHGIDRDAESILFAQKLFEHVPIESAFIHGKIESVKEGGPRYDIVLFLGVYHHLYVQVGKASANKIVLNYLKKTKKFFAVRTSGKYVKHIIALLEERKSGFQFLLQTNQGGSVGSLRIYERRGG